MTATVFENYKAQAMVLVPIVKALEKEMGLEKAQRLINDALGETFREFGRKLYDETEKGNEGNFGEQAVVMCDAFGEGGALECEVQEKTKRHLKFKITKCKYAELYKSLNAPELGFLFACGQDYPLNNGMRDDLVMERPQTIMEGHSHCQFSWYIAKDVEEAKKAREEIESGLWARKRKIENQSTHASVAYSTSSR